MLLDQCLPADLTHEGALRSVNNTGGDTTAREHCRPARGFKTNDYHMLEGPPTAASSTREE